jgi:sec-independent protein translocase protein TatA
MTPLVLGLGVPELLIILAVVLLLFGGARLAGWGRAPAARFGSSRKRPRA